VDAFRCTNSPVLIADGDHARVDAYASLAVIASTVAIAAGAPILDPLIGLGMTVVILAHRRRELAHRALTPPLNARGATSQPHGAGDRARQAGRDR
jgi:Co/Zn/Cd efflux system component